MADGKIYIVITDQRPTTGGVGNQGTGSDTEKEDSSSSSSLGKYAFHRFANFMEAQAVKVVNYSINNIGNFTGDYVSQRETQAAVNGLTKLYNIGNAFFVGTKMAGGNPLGGVIAASIAVGAEAINIALEVHSLQVQQKKSNYEIGQLKLRSGLNGLTDGSRGTEN